MTASSASSSIVLVPSLSRFRFHPFSSFSFSFCLRSAPKWLLFAGLGTSGYAPHPMKYKRPIPGALRPGHFIILPPPLRFCYSVPLATPAAKELLLRERWGDCRGFLETREFEEKARPKHERGLYSVNVRRRERANEWDVGRKSALERDGTRRAGVSWRVVGAQNSVLLFFSAFRFHSRLSLGDFHLFRPSLSFC